MNKTGDIKDFVITEESGIAKGIRRVVAVTGNEAVEVRRVADGLHARLDQLDAMGGKEKDAGLKAYQVVRMILFICSYPIDNVAQELNQADISVIKKAELVERLAHIRKAFDKQRKDKEAAANKAVSISSHPR